MGAGAAVGRHGEDDRYLVVAAEAGCVELMEVLIEAGASLYRISEGMITSDGALLAAIKGGHLAAVQFIVNMGIEVRCPPNLDISPLMMAITSKNLEITRYSAVLSNDLYVLENDLIERKQEGKNNAVAH